MKKVMLVIGLVMAAMSSTAVACNLDEAIQTVIAKDGINSSNQSVNATDNKLQVGSSSVVISLVDTMSAEGYSCSRIVACDPATNQYQFLARHCGN